MYNLFVHMCYLCLLFLLFNHLFHHEEKQTHPYITPIPLCPVHIHIHIQNHAPFHWQSGIFYSGALKTEHTWKTPHSTPAKINSSTAHETSISWQVDDSPKPCGSGSNWDSREWVWGILLLRLCFPTTFFFFLSVFFFVPRFCSLLLPHVTDTER